MSSNLPTGSTKADAVIFEREGAIVILTLNKPDARNPTTDPDILAGLNAALASVAADSLPADLRRF